MYLSRFSHGIFLCFLTGVFCFFASSAHAWYPLVVHGRCVKTGTACRTTIGNPSSKSGCCVPEDKDEDTCRATNFCLGKHPYHWKPQNLPLRWWFSPNGMVGQASFTNSTLVQLETALKQAWNEWSVQPCTSFLHSYAGPSKSKAKSFDGKVIVQLSSIEEWGKMGLDSYTLAVTMVLPNNKGEIFDADIYFNPNMSYFWGAGKIGANDIDFKVVARHEIGHALGFAHSPSKKATMFYSMLEKGEVKRPLTADDIGAVCTIYPTKSCKDNTQCLGDCQSCQGGRCVDVSPVKATSCRPCGKDGDCDASRERCIKTNQGKICLPRCVGTGNCCPVGYSCSVFGQEKLCEPTFTCAGVLRCLVDSDCGSTMTCQQGLCVTRQPGEWCKGNCSSHADCKNGQLCTQLGDKKYCLFSCGTSALCPRGSSCRGQQGWSEPRCVPENPRVCTCTNNADCPSGQTCAAGECKPGNNGGVRGSVCRDRIPCASGFVCTASAGISACYAQCGEPSFALGVAGSPCRSDNTCTDGSTCVTWKGTQSLCIKTCQSNANCTGGMQCLSFPGQTAKACRCTGDSQCGAGGVCRFYEVAGTLAGHCAKKQTWKACQSNERCMTVAPGYTVCYPTKNAGTRNKGETCQNHAECKSGLACLKYDPGARKGNCVTACKTNAQCSNGDTCLVIGERGYCACKQDKDCKQGYRCEMVSENHGYCKACPGGNCSQGPACGNGRCENQAGENCATCARDCGCQTGFRCESNACVPIPSNRFCGDGICDRQAGENCSVCASDCRCPSGQSCQQGVCQSESTGDAGSISDENDDFCTNGTLTVNCEDGRCIRVCVRSGCVCQTNSPEDNSGLLWWLVLMGLGLGMRYRRTSG